MAFAITAGMKPVDSRLLKHLVLAVVLKLLVLGALWWTFVRDDKVSVDAEQAANHFGSATSSGERP